MIRRRISVGLIAFVPLLLFKFIIIGLVLPGGIVWFLSFFFLFFLLHGEKHDFQAQEFDDIDDCRTEN